VFSAEIIGMLAEKVKQAGYGYNHYKDQTYPDFINIGCDTVSDIAYGIKEAFVYVIGFAIMGSAMWKIAD